MEIYLLEVQKRVLWFVDDLKNKFDDIKSGK